MTSDFPIVQTIEFLHDEERLSFSAIAEELNRRYEERHYTKDSVQKIYKKFVHQKDSAKQFKTVDDYREYLGDYWHWNGIPSSEPGPVRVVAGVGDLHGLPDRKVLSEVVSVNPDIVVVGGDSLDSRQANPHKSDFQKNTRRMKEEIAAVRAWTQVLLDETDAIIYFMHGNHDMWLWNMIVEALPEWTLDFFQEPVQMILEGLPVERVKRVKQQFNICSPSGDIDSFSETQFLFVLGDALFSHMNFTGKRAGMAVDKLGAWIDQWHAPLGLPEFALLAQFHGHKAALFDDKGGYRTLVEPGMGGSLSVEEYKVNYLGSWMPGRTGFLVFEQFKQGNEWKTDTASAQLVRPRRYSAASMESDSG